jgi:hypothetical protein
MLEAEKQFRKVIGYQDLAKLAVAIGERDNLRGDVAGGLTEQHSAL